MLLNERAMIAAIAYVTGLTVRQRREFVNRYFILVDRSDKILAAQMILTDHLQEKDRLNLPN